MTAEVTGEKNLRQPVATHMRNAGYEVYFEVPFKGKKPDIVCLKRDEDSVITIELKVKKWKIALNQASLYYLWSNQTYAAFPENLNNLVERNRELFESEGVGVMLVIVKTGEVREVVEPREAGNYDAVWMSGMIKMAQEKGERFLLDGRR